MAVETTWEKDQPIELRDGTVIYCDVFRPTSSENAAVPALIAWGPFGKSSNGTLSEAVSMRIDTNQSDSCCGVYPMSRLSLVEQNEIQSRDSQELDQWTGKLGSSRSCGMVRARLCYCQRLRKRQL